VNHTNNGHNGERVSEGARPSMCLRLRAVTTSASYDLKSYAGAILRDQAGRLLIVEPTYKELWEIPGVVIEALESPLSTVVRELQEELGIRFHASEFSPISVDYLRETDVQTESLMFLFRGPLFDEQRISSIQLANAELSSFAFVNPEDAHTKLGQSSVHEYCVLARH